MITRGFEGYDGSLVIHINMQFQYLPKARRNYSKRLRMGKRNQQEGEQVKKTKATVFRNLERRGMSRDWSVAAGPLSHYALRKLKNPSSS